MTTFTGPPAESEDPTIQHVKTLMVAGPRESQEPGIQEETRTFLLEVFRQMGKVPPAA